MHSGEHVQPKVSSLHRKVSLLCPHRYPSSEKFSMSIENKPEPVASVADRFTETLRKTLEHIGDSQWLEQNSPLASALFIGSLQENSPKPQLAQTGRANVDAHLQTIWDAWSSQPKSPLQETIWQALSQFVEGTDAQLQVILLLTYFDEERPKQSQVLRSLAVSRATYYRQLNRAVEALAHALVKSIRPALRLERPTARPLIGRRTEIDQAQAGLVEGQVVHIVGGSGLGKTALAAHLAEAWPNGVFWYTFRPHLSDHLENLLFAIAYFLHEQGTSGLWLYLTTDAQAFNPVQAMLILRQHLEDMKETPPLFCFDEVSLLLGDELNDVEAHVHLRHFLEEWQTMERCGSPLLLIGQKLLFEPDQTRLIYLRPFLGPELSSLIADADIELEEEPLNHLQTFTRGNPLLLRLFIVLYQRNQSVIDTLAQMETPMTLDWFLARLHQHLTPNERIILDELSVFQDDAPIHIWQRTQSELQALVSLNLVQKNGPHWVSLHPALRTRIYARLSLERQSELHLAAGHALAEQGYFTAAAWHYIRGDRPDVAIWTWYTHQQHELDQGQGCLAFSLFAPLAQTSLPRADDQRALALMLAPLYKGHGRPREGLDLLDKAIWPSGAVSTAKAHEARGELYIDVGEIDRGLAELRRGLESVQRLRPTEEAELHLRIARSSFARLSDVALSLQHVSAARLSIEILQGRIKQATGDYDSARVHYASALDLAAGSTDHLRLLKIHEGMGFLEALLGHVDEAVVHAKAVERHYKALGHPVGTIAAPNSILAVAYLVAQQYEAVLDPAETALSYFKELEHAYWISLNETYLAEAWFYLGDIEKAEEYAQSALRHEEVNVRPYCLYILGQVERVRENYEQAEVYCQAAIQEGEAQENPDAAAPAWSALAETLRDAGRINEARQAFAKSIEIWTSMGLANQAARIQSMLDAVTTL